MLAEVLAAVLVGLVVVAAIISPLTRPGVTAPPGVDEPEDLDETPKGIALAALREIEFDRETGKLSDEDYATLKGRYTAEALAILRQEEGPKVPEASATPTDAPGVPGDPVEAMIAERVKKLSGPAIRCPGCGPRPETDALFCSGCGRSLTVGGCASCGSPLVPGSQFCEGCGTAVAR
ncbi:MAG: zinc ribbon domain-containing protein [Gemmatimonadetes bacterium]|nr:zinc ribbon domain-containing protein [Gemmatimonadota bacterium]MBK7783915.1 zinc ribbon domain-containing protein [Gemmatimonadota bacterium]MBK9068038.1 zinc ribbon domain-containing protein [Gemmatimonadota bacterium]MBK9690715.1 zinc ribbon domain-containing protein [Gemmatimonadota bacterium]